MAMSAFEVLIDIWISPVDGEERMFNATRDESGTHIELSIGVVLGISTMAAAALGNLVSDLAGLGSPHLEELPAGLQRLQRRAGVVMGLRGGKWTRVGAGWPCAEHWDEEEEEEDEEEEEKHVLLAAEGSLVPSKAEDEKDDAQEGGHSVPDQGIGMARTEVETKPEGSRQAKQLARQKIHLCRKERWR
ncbi:Transmembrane protein 65 [Liparis tanakae]|uniref:Transmembrane protein 65 n=1 Tax=Liparis tanakae TaxID=230148 RepID=A0A4Z2IQL8_9TELE|nr:Transmembrane protein 65 [Liparis tanakae]